MSKIKDKKILRIKHWCLFINKLKIIENIIN